MNTAMTTKPIEQGWPIMRRTACHVGQHVFSWTGIDRDENVPPDKLMRCDCGALTWENANEGSKPATDCRTKAGEDAHDG